MRNPFVVLKIQDGHIPAIVGEFTDESDAESYIGARAIDEYGNMSDAFNCPCLIIVDRDHGPYSDPGCSNW